MHRILLFAVSVLISCGGLAAEKRVGSQRCLRVKDPVACLMQASLSAVKNVKSPDERAEAIADLLYALAETRGRDDALRASAEELAHDPQVPPQRQIDLLFGIDLYESSGNAESLPTFRAALRRFDELERSLQGRARVELYFSACSILTWVDSFRGRWLDFARAVCTPERLRALDLNEAADRGLVLAMMPMAMTIAEDQNGFVASAGLSLSWLGEAERLAAGSHKLAEHEFAAFFGVLIHTMNALCLDAFEEEDGANREVELALQSLRGLEKRIGISDRSTPLRRPVVESLYTIGRAAEAKRLLRQMMARIDADPAGKRIRPSEQVSILALAARIEFEERAPRQALECRPDDAVTI